MSDQPDLAALVLAAIETFDDVAETYRIWRAMSADRMAEVIAARLEAANVRVAAPLTFDVNCPDCISNGVLCHVHRGAAPRSEDAIAAAEPKEPQSEAKVWRSEDAAPLRAGICECGPICAACGRRRVAGDAGLREAVDAVATSMENRATWDAVPTESVVAWAARIRAALATPTDTEAGR